jgi:glycerol uptake facilitator protein
MNTTAFLGELVGTAILILLGDGVVANVLLPRTKGNSSGWIVRRGKRGHSTFLACSVARGGEASIQVPAAER